MGAIEKQQVYQDFCRVQAQQREPWYKTDELSSHYQNTVNFPGGESGIHGTFVLTNGTPGQIPHPKADPSHQGPEAYMAHHPGHLKGSIEVVVQ